MEITEIRIYPVNDLGPLKAYVSIVLDNGFAVHDLKIIQSETKTFVSMPNKKDKTGKWRDIVHPINQAAREKIEKEILAKYKSLVSVQETPSQEPNLEEE